MDKKTTLTNDELKMMALELNVRTLAAQVELLQRYIQKLDEVYYHVFPERFEKDVKFHDQLMALMKFNPKKQ